MSVATVFTPKQVAQALGVSESSVKRWVDQGQLPAAKTVGGHRKVPLDSVVEFVRTTGHSLERPSVLGMVPTIERSTLEEAQDDLFNLVVRGAEPGCRELLLGCYQRGDSIVDLGDRLIGPVFRRIGDGWEAGDVAVRQERRACEVVMATLHELRRWLPLAPETAPLAVVATPCQDFAEVAARLIELSLVVAGWRVVQAGSGLPMSEIGDSAAEHRPALVCLSATHLADSRAFVTAVNDDLRETLDKLNPRPLLAVGGSALCGDWRNEIRCDLLAESLADLITFEPQARRSAGDADRE